MILVSICFLVGEFYNRLTFLQGWGSYDVCEYFVLNRYLMCV